MFGFIKGILISSFLRLITKFRRVMAYVQWKGREFHSCGDFVDTRFSTSNMSFEYPFAWCMEIVGYDSLDNKVRLSGACKDNIRNVGIRKDTILTFTHFKRYCSLPHGVYSIHISLFDFASENSNIFSLRPNSIRFVCENQTFAIISEH